MSRFLRVLRELVRNAAIEPCCHVGHRMTLVGFAPDVITKVVVGKIWYVPRSPGCDIDGGFMAAPIGATVHVDC